MNGSGLILHSPAGFVIAFGAGIVSFLSPCVLPLVPSYLSMMSGVSGAQLASASRADQRRLLRSTLLFVAGFTVVFAGLEATANGIAQPLQHHQRGLDQVAGAVIVLAGLAFAGLRPGVLQRDARLRVRPSRLGEWAAPVMGMAFAFGWTPCIGPALASVLSLAADAHTLWRGEAMLVAFSLGLGVPFVAFGVAFGRLTGVLHFARVHARAINVTSGALLALLGVLLLTGSVHLLSSWATSFLDHVGLGRFSTV